MFRRQVEARAIAVRGRGKGEQRRYGQGVTLGVSACSSVEERRPSKPRVGGSNPSRRALDALAAVRPKGQRPTTLDCTMLRPRSLYLRCVLPYAPRLRLLCRRHPCASRAAPPAKHPCEGLRFDTYRQWFEMYRLCRPSPVDMPSPSRRSANSLEPASADPSGFPAVSTPDGGISTRAMHDPRVG